LLLIKPQGIPGERESLANHDSLCAACALQGIAYTVRKVQDNGCLLSALPKGN